MNLDAKVMMLLVQAFRDPVARRRTIALLFACWVTFRWVATIAIVVTLWWAIVVVAVLVKVLTSK